MLRLWFGFGVHRWPSDIRGGSGLKWCQWNDSWVLSNQFGWTAVLCAKAILHIQTSFPNHAVVEEQRKGAETGLVMFVKCQISITEGRSLPFNCESN